MSYRDINTRDIQYKEDKKLALRLNSHDRDIAKILRILQRADSKTATQKTISNPSSTPSDKIDDHGQLKGLTDDDHPQYLRIDGTRAMTGDLDINSFDINNINIARFKTTPTNVTPQEGDVWWDATKGVLNIKSKGDATMQVGLENWDEGYNDTGDTLLNGSVVFPNGIANGLGSAVLAKADSYDTAKHPLAIVTENIIDGSSGKVTVFGDVNGINTSGLSLGPIFLSDTVAGALTSTPPTHPSIRYQIGFCKVVHATDGVIFVMQNNLDVISAFNGTFREAFDAFAVSDDGINAYVTLERKNGGDLTMRFSDGYTTLDCTPEATATLTVGTDSSPQENFVYIPFSTKVLTVSTSGWPTEQHIKITYLYLPSATAIQNGEVFVTQNWNDSDADGNTGQGHQSHIGERIRRQGAVYNSGIDPNGVDSYFTLGAGTGYFKSTSGVIYQMHKHSVEAFEMNGGGDHAHIPNDSVTAFLKTFNLSDITKMADGTNLSNNKYFNLVFWMVGNKTGSSSPLMINLPTGQYTLKDAAIRDDDKTAVYDIPREFNKESSTAFFVCRATFQYGSTWVLWDVEDLRGRDPTVSGGASTATAQVEFPTNTHRLYDNLDNTKQLAHDVSGISTGITRTITMVDRDITLIDITDVNTSIATHAVATDPHGDRAYADSLDHDHATPIGIHAGISDAHHSKTVSSEIDHNLTTNFDADKHINWKLASQGIIHATNYVDNDTTYVSSDFTHNDLTGINDGDINHLTDIQVTALHAEVTSLAHSAITGVGVSDHHVRYTDAEAVAAVDLSGYLPLTGGAMTGNITTTGLFDGVDVGALFISVGLNTSSIGDNALTITSNHNTFLLHSVDVDAHHAKTVSSEIVHNSVSGLNDGAVYNHMTDAQITALHPVVTTLAIGDITGFTDNSTDWDLNTTYRGVGHLPLAGGTVTGAFSVSNAGGAGNFPTIVSSSGFTGLSIQVPTGSNSFIEGKENSVKTWGIDYKTATSTLEIQIGSTAIITLNSAGIDVTGNIGLNTSDIEAWASPYKVIESKVSALMMGDTNANIGLISNAYYDGAYKRKTAASVAQILLTSGGHLFRVAGSGTINSTISWTTAIQILNNGNVGLGTSPSYQLHLSTNSAAKPTSSVWTISSDERIKTIIGDYEMGLAEIMQVKVRRWSYNGEFGFKTCTQGHVGIIANEIENVFPDTVKEIDYQYVDGIETKTVSNFKQFDNDELTYALITSVQQLKREGDAKDDRIANLETLLTSLTTRIIKLETN